MKAHLQKFVLIALFHMALLTAEAATADKEISVDAVLDKYIKATGGKEAWNKIESRVVKAEMSFPGGTAEWSSQAKAPNKRLTRIESKQTGLYLSGFDGDTAWTKSYNGIQIKKGDELSRAKSEAEFYREVRMKETYPTLSFKGTETIDGEEVYTLESKTPAGTETYSYSKKTGLQLKAWSEFTNPDGTKIQVEVQFADYRVFEGITYPYSQRTRILPPGQPPFEMVLKVKEIKHNEKIEESIFSKPTE